MWAYVNVDLIGACKINSKKHIRTFKSCFSNCSLNFRNSGIFVRVIFLSGISFWVWGCCTTHFKKRNEVGRIRNHNILPKNDHLLYIVATQLFSLRSLWFYIFRLLALHFTLKWFRYCYSWFWLVEILSASNILVYTFPFYAFHTAFLYYLFFISLSDQVSRNYFERPDSKFRNCRLL